MSVGKRKKIIIKKHFPNGFDKNDENDMMKLTVLIQEQAAINPEYQGYGVYRVDPAGQWVIIAPMDDEADLKIKDGTIGQTLPILDCTDPAKQVATVRRMQEQNPSYTVVDIGRGSNAKEGVVLMEQLDDKTIAVRQRFADLFGLGRKPWHIRVNRTPEHGWKIRIKEDSGVVYQPSKHDVKLQEAAELIGAPGWFFKANPDTNIIVIYPGKPPTLPKTMACPDELKGKGDLRHAYIGMKLPDRGRETGDWVYNDWKTGPGIMVAAAANSGKSVVINSIIAGALEAGFQLAICDDEDKSVDFQWCRPWVIDKGWGCDGIESCAATLSHVLNICMYRARIIKKYGAENWWGLPDDVKKEHPLLLLVCDEVAQWAGSVTIPKVEKDNPMRIRAEYEATIHAASITYAMKITQKARFAGICFLFAGQSIRLQDGFDPGMRVNLTTVISPTLQPADAVVDLLDGSKEIPAIPDNIMQDGRSIGAGLIRLPGQRPFIYKGFYEEDREHGKGYSDMLKDRLLAIRPPEGDMNSGHWGWDDIVLEIPAAAARPDDGRFDDYAPASRLDTEGGFGIDGRDVADRDAPLKGAAAAAHASRLYAEGAKPPVSGADMADVLSREMAARGM